MDANEHPMPGRLISVSAPDKIRRMKIDLAQFLGRKTANTEVKTLEIELHHDHCQILPDDLFHEILVFLPSESLLKLLCVCKQWFSLINNSSFIRAHAYQSETVLIYKRSLNFGESRTFFQLSSLEDGRTSFVESSSCEFPVCIQASCDGMILVSYEDGVARRKWKLVNPVMRKQRSIEIPLGRPPEYSFESFGMAYSNEAKTYKIAHLYNERGRPFSSSSCEIMSLGSTWTKIKGPSVIVNYQDIPVCIGGSLHWLSVQRDYCVSFNVCDEKFVMRKLSHGIRDCWNIKLVDIGGNLGCLNGVQVWILREECWIKWNVIRKNDGVGWCVPICSRKNGKEILIQTEYFPQLYAYNYDKDEFKPVRSGRAYEEPWFGSIRNNFFLYKKTLVW